MRKFTKFNTRWIVIFILVILSFSISTPALADSAADEKVPGKMVLIPGGSFEAGAEGFNDDESPIHTVTLDSFFLDKYEVTQKDYQKVVGKNPSRFKGENSPVERVSWYKAWKYCKKIGKRLPTEAEWEYAARGGANGGDPGGYWHKGNTTKTQSVGQRNPNSLGLYDMLGNVWEWIADWYDPNYYQNSPSQNPKGPKKAKKKVIRGGSWNNTEETMRPTYRSYYAPGARTATFGFRCAK